MGSRLKYRLAVYGLGFAVLAIMGIAAAVQKAYTEFQKSQERQNLASAFGADVAEFCETRSGGEAIVNINPDASITDADGNGWKALVLRTDDARRHDWHKLLPAAAQATKTSELDVIVCVHEEMELWEACPYTKNGDDGPTLFTITRLQQIVTISFHNGKTGQALDSRVLVGGYPEECPDEFTASTGTSNIDYKGTPVDYSAFFAEFSSFLSGR